MPSATAAHRRTFATRRPPPAFTVDTGVETATVALVAPRGELDLFAAPELRDALRRVSDSAVVVILDLRGLTFCDTTGVHVVDEANTAARACDRRLVVVPPPDRVRAVFDLTGISDRLDFAADPNAVAGAGPEDW